MYLSEKPIFWVPNNSSKETEEEHEAFDERIRKTFYYGKLPGTERPSLPVTDLLVDFYNEAAPRELGKLDTYFAASSSRSACITPSSVMAGMVYVKRLKKRQPEYLTQVSSSELFLISMMMASKFLYDEGIDEEVFNDEWATSGDLDTEDINQLELDFLAAIDWQLFVKPEEFSDMLRKIEQRIALKQGLERGWFSYTDLMILSQDLKFMNWKHLVTELSTVFSATSLAYLAGILTMVGSTVIGTATTVTLMRTGSNVLPVCLKTLPVLNLYLELSLDEARSLPEVPQPDASSISGIESLMQTDIEQLMVQNNSYSSQFEGNSTAKETGITESRSTPETKTHSKSQQRDQNGLLNGFLPPFLALFTLKDTLFNFAYGARLSNEPEETDHTDLEPKESDQTADPTGEICSAGPCLVDSLLNCWNVTLETDWTWSETWTERNCFDKTQCCPHCLHRIGSYDKFGLDLDTMKGAEIVHCCCRLGNTGNSWLKESLQFSLMDINLRFSTRSFYPVFVTT